MLKQTGGGDVGVGGIGVGVGVVGVFCCWWWRFFWCWCCVNPVVLNRRRACYVCRHACKGMFFYVGDGSVTGVGGNGGVVCWWCCSCCCCLLLVVMSFWSWCFWSCSSRRVVVSDFGAIGVGGVVRDGCFCGVGDEHHRWCSIKSGERVFSPAYKRHAFWC